jgi:hypothetical protein
VKPLLLGGEQLGPRLHVTIFAKKLQYRNTAERNNFGREFALPVMAEWLTPHLSESAKLV